METIKEKQQIFTVGRLRQAHNLASTYQKIPSPFGWACLRAIEKIDKCLKKYEQELVDKQRELAVTYKDGDKKGCYVLGPNDSLTHTAESLKKLNEFVESQKDIEVEYEPYYATKFDEIKSNLKALDILNGIVIEKINLEDYVNLSVTN